MTKREVLLLLKDIFDTAYCSSFETTSAEDLADLLGVIVDQRLGDAYCDEIQ